jgi:hypothetical protein
VRVASWQPNENSPGAFFDDRGHLQKFQPDLSHSALCQIGVRQADGDHAQKDVGETGEHETKRVGAEPMAACASRSEIELQLFDSVLAVASKAVKIVDASGSLLIFVTT